MTREVEIKIKLDCRDVRLVEEAVTRLGYKLCSTSREIDIYYCHPCYNIFESDQAIRVRVRKPIEDNRTDKGVDTILTYKGPRSRDHQGKVRTEYEVRVSDADTLKEIFKQLGFKPSVTVSKTRLVYKKDCMNPKKQATITFDQVESSIGEADMENIGCFMEIELIDEDPSRIAEIISEIEGDLRMHGAKINLNDRTTKSYVELYLESIGKELKDVDCPGSGSSP